MEELIRDLIKCTTNWECLDWHKFRREYYDDYFAERDNIIIESSNNPQDKSLKYKLESKFKYEKLYNIKKYNSKYGIR